MRWSDRKTIDCTSDEILRLGWRHVIETIRLTSINGETINIRVNGIARDQIREVCRGWQEVESVLDLSVKNSIGDLLPVLADSAEWELSESLKENPSDTLVCKLIMLSKNPRRS